MHDRLRILALCFVVMMAASRAAAQCAMCKASAETSVEAGSTAAKGINIGVLYLLAFPFLFLGLLGYYAWRMRHAAG